MDHINGNESNNDVNNIQSMTPYQNLTKRYDNDERQNPRAPNLRFKPEAHVCDEKATSWIDLP
jgi:hypothetical protein